jgi:hypothetical protein
MAVQLLWNFIVGLIEASNRRWTRKFKEQLKRQWYSYPLEDRKRLKLEDPRYYEWPINENGVLTSHELGLVEAQRYRYERRKLGYLD